MKTLAESDNSIPRSQTRNRLSRLPVFSRTALKLLTIATEADSEREDFDSAFRSDPSLATDRLIIANSTDFGFRVRVAAFRTPLSLVGLGRVRSVARTIARSFYLRSSASRDLTDHGKRVFSHVTFLPSVRQFSR
jgi:HD-like signal output (HDOD) protein